MKLKRLYLVAWLVVALLHHKQSYGQVADFTSNTTQGCTPLIVNFQDLSSGGGLTYFWDFGNGNTSTLQNPGAIYQTPGTYTVKLIVTNGSGTDSMVKTNYITVFALPNAGFYVDTTQGCTPATIKFTDTSKQGSGSINTWLWDFGDGFISTQANTSHIYRNSGVFSVSLQVEDVNGCKNTRLLTNLIRISTFTSVDFVANDTHSCIQLLSANFKPTVVGGTSPYKYTWQFGDGNTSSVLNPSNIYTTFGKFTVSFTVKDANNCQATVTKKDYINLENVVADFTSSVRSGCSPLKVAFVNKTTPANKYKFYWDFGNGETSTATDTIIEYLQQGSYDVKLVAVSPSCRDTVIKKNAITIIPSPNVNFTLNDSLACKAPLTINYKASSSGNITQWEWNFGDGTTANIQNPAKTYYAEGDYTVTLKVTANNGCITLLEKVDQVKIHSPQAIINLDKDRGCKPLTVNFKGDAKSLFPITSWEWRSDDNTQAYTQDYTHTYKDTGLYIPWLIVTDSKGCKDTVKKDNIQVGLKPKADFWATPRVGCIHDFKSAFTNLTNNGTVQADSFKWEFGDGGASNEEEPTHKFEDAKPGLYNVVLYASHRGCTDTMEKKAYIQLLPPYAKIEPQFKFKCDPDSVSFINKSQGGHLYEWTFSNGYVSTEKDVIRKFPAGNLVAILTVTDTVYNCSHTDTAKVVIPRTFNPNFTYNPGIGCVPLSVKFTDMSSGAIDWKWEFGNGARSTIPSPTIIFDVPGTFSVRLTISNDSGCIKTLYIPNAITVFGTDVQASVDVDTGCIPLKVTLKDLSRAVYPTLKTYWDMGNGDTFSIATGTTKTYTFTKPPPDQRNGFSVKLFVADSSGCLSNKVFPIYPLSPSTKNSHVVVATCNTAKYTFFPDLTSSAGLAPFDYTWDFGDGPLNTRQPVKEYMNDGDYTYSLKIRDAYGCIAFLTDTIHALKKPLKAGFSADPMTSFCPPLLVSFTDTTVKGHSSITQWKWYFDDQSSIFLRNPKKNYVLPGKYAVSLVVKDSLGCMDSVTIPNLILVDGPTGTYTFDPSSGCLPLQVNFRSVTQGATRIRWDLGDGTLVDGDSHTYVYHRVGSFIPVLILSNDKGCTYSLPPIDTIKVFSLPRALIASQVNCSGKTSTFRSNSFPGQGNIVQRSWKINGEIKSSSDTFKHNFALPGIYKLTLIVHNTLGCSDSLTIDVQVPGVSAELVKSDLTGCLDRQSKFQANIVTDFDALADLYWYFGDGFTQSGLQNPVHHRYLNAGIYNPKVVATTMAGCQDTSEAFSILIGDTIPPLPPNFYRVTVENNSSVRIDFGSAKDIDFKQYLLKRYDPDGSSYTVFMSGNRNDTTFTNGGLNTLHNIYRYRLFTQNICNYISDSTSTEMHATIEVTAVPDTNQSMLRWNHYEGWDKVKYYVILKEDPNKRGKWDSIGSVPGSENSFIDTNVICYRSHYYRIRAIEEMGFEQISFSDTTGVAPVHKPKVPSNELIRITVENDKEIWIEWLPAPASRFKTKGYIVEKSADGFNYTQPWPHFIPGDIRQTDNRVKVDDLNYYYRMQVIDSCGDLGPYSNVSKSILLQVQLNPDERPMLNWNPYEGWASGVDHYEVERQEANGNFVLLGKTDPNVTTFTDEVSEWNGRNSYCYRITAYRSPTISNPEEVISHSNVDCAPVISRLHVPNAFTPNSDEINPLFEIKGIYIREYNLRIYNRWGEFVYESNSLLEHWNGRYKGETAQQDVYVYLISALGVDNRKYNLKGNVTLLR